MLVRLAFMSSYTYAYRGGIIENRHRISTAIVNSENKLVASSGNPELLAHLRSSAKPFQVQALFQAGADKRFGFTDKEIALACASHSGTPEHINVAKGMLDKLGLSESDLACGIHWPGSKEERVRLEQANEKPNALHNNCSGKHSGMLAVAKMLNAPAEGYEKPEHPVQQLNFQIIRDLSGVREIPFGVDGCSVPAFVLPLAKAAWLFAQLANPQGAPEKYRKGLDHTCRAMKTFPEMVAGEGEIDTVLMQQISGLVCKQGADGYYGISLRETNYGPLGVVLKVEDGNTAAREPAVIRLLELLGVLSADNTLPWKRPVIRNHRKIETGYLESHIDLEWH
jgi:L-asparaginase II